MRTVAELLERMPTNWLETYVSVFEAGRVQAWPQARFVNGAGECCVVGALAGARTSTELATLPLYAEFRGGALEELSRRFESRRLSGQEFYEECLLAIASRTVLAAHAGWAVPLLPAPATPARPSGRAVGALPARVALPTRAIRPALPTRAIRPALPTRAIRPALPTRAIRPALPPATPLLMLVPARP